MRARYAALPGVMARSCRSREPPTVATVRCGATRISSLIEGLGGRIALNMSIASVTSGSSLGHLPLPATLLGRVTGSPTRTARASAALAALGQHLTRARRLATLGRTRGLLRAALRPHRRGLRLLLLQQLLAQRQEALAIFSEPVLDAFETHLLYHKGQRVHGFPYQFVDPLLWIVSRA